MKAVQIRLELFVPMHRWKKTMMLYGRRNIDRQCCSSNRSDEGDNVTLTTSG
ncbi:hypothetical protein [Faecalicoccus pleomorphus]|uniref:hypothetical protein n=1 Tax=Faecalicoccus pleomorphus TaxID=1323 RepID=UPI0022DF9360|nr:hypothetical protein [Faecalicoccus pleomorphus]